MHGTLQPRPLGSCARVVFPELAEMRAQPGMKAMENFSLAKVSCKAGRVPADGCGWIDNVSSNGKGVLRLDAYFIINVYTIGDGMN